MLAAPASADAQADFQVSRVSTPPLIDGKLTDEAWNEAPLDLGRWIWSKPAARRAHGPHDRRPHRVRRPVYLLRLPLLRPRAARIRTTISRRDNVFNDDWIALSLDSTGTGQTAYHLFVNPCGIQMARLNTRVGRAFEVGLLWDSAGEVSEDGYVVEVRLPLQTIRFSGGEQ